MGIPYPMWCTPLPPQGTRYEVGDIVSILDEGGKVYYALLRGFLEDQYSEKYAVLTWLIPTVPNPKIFDPSLFVLGESNIVEPFN